MLSRGRSGGAGECDGLGRLLHGEDGQVGHEAIKNTILPRSYVGSRGTSALDAASLSDSAFVDRFDRDDRTRRS